MAYSRRKDWEQARLLWALTSVRNLAAPAASLPTRVAGHRWLEPDDLLAAMGVKL